MNESPTSDNTGAMAWTIKEHPDPFMPLVFEGITNDEIQIGTTDDMRDWKGKLRRPPKM